MGAEHSSRVSTMAGEHCRWVWEQNILLAFPQWIENFLGHLSSVPGGSPAGGKQAAPAKTNRKSKIEFRN